MGEATVTVTRYETSVHARNRHAGFGIPVIVYAANLGEAVSKALDVGWSGYRRDGRVTVRSVTQEVIPLPPTPAPPPRSTADESRERTNR